MWPVVWWLVGAEQQNRVNIGSKKFPFLGATN